MATALLIAAPASGQGKTTVAAGLARLHVRQGRVVRCFKYGADFLDPLWLTTASGHPVHSLDLWINGEEDCARRLAKAASDADVVIIEGVMGLFDGHPSAADFARRFGIPIVAVIDASAMAGTFAAVSHGLRTWCPDLPWAGVFANRVAGERHAGMLRDAVDSPRTAAQGDWLGHLPRRSALVLPQRHLGLSMPEESADALARLDATADLLAATPLGQRGPWSDAGSASSIASWSHWIPPAIGDTKPARRTLTGQRISVARDAAFAFVYPANLEVLQDLGAELVFFSPLAGDPLPPCEAVWLPGGYPELHAARLAQLAKLPDQLKDHVGAGKPLWAECGGLMALTDWLIDGGGQSHAMWGLLPGTAALGRSLAALGPQTLSIDSEGIAALRGHSFHWSRLETPLTPNAHTSPADATAEGAGEPVYEAGSLRASWFHPWFASSPEITARLFQPQPLFAPRPVETHPCPAWRMN